jgi:hypothetical protein
MKEQVPKRIQRKRTKGWRKPEGAVDCTRPGRWGNPFTVKECGTAEAAVECFRVSRSTMPQEIDAIKNNLRGKDLMCWCSLYKEDGRRTPCHADVLLEIANR